MVQKPLEITLPYSVLLVQSVSKGPGAGDGEVIGVFDALLLAHLRQVVNILAGAGRVEQHVVVDRQIVTGAVADQHVAVAVQNIASSSFDTGKGDIGDGVVCIAAGFDDLLVIQLKRKESQDQRKNCQQNMGAESAYSFHVSPPMDSIDSSSGYRMGIMITEMAPVIRNPLNRSHGVNPRIAPSANSAIS